MKKRLSVSLFLLFILSVALLSACKTSAGPSNYNVAGVQTEIPSITTIVGERNFAGSSVTRYAKAEDGNLAVTCAYSGAERPEEDVSRYCAVLVSEKGFTLQSDYSTGQAVLTAPSDNEGERVQMTITPRNSDGYTITTELLEIDAASESQPAA